MRRPPDPKSERAPLPGRPNHKADFHKPKESTDTVPELQARILRRRFAPAYYFASAIAALAFAGGPR
jgi:hypothetical protein